MWRQFLPFFQLSMSYRDRIHTVRLLCLVLPPLSHLSGSSLGSLNVFTNPFVAGRDRALRWNKSVLGVLHIFLMQEATLGLPFPLITFHLSYIGIHSCVCVPFTLTVKYHQRCEISQPPPPTTYFANVDSSRFLG